jgi:hypothetical protein
LWIVEKNNHLVLSNSASSVCYAAIVLQAIRTNEIPPSISYPDFYVEDAVSQGEQQAATATSSQIAHRTLRLTRSGYGTRRGARSTSSGIPAAYQLTR